MYSQNINDMKRTTTFQMKVSIMLFIVLFSLTGAWAENVTTEQARNEALDFLMSQKTISGKPRRAPGTMPQLTLQGKVSGLYVFNVDTDGGFVIVSNDDRTIPILGFSDSGSFDPASMPDNMRAWLQGYADEIAWLQQNNGTAKSNVSKGRRKVGSHSTTAITPLCTSTWNQGAPYNNLCPKYDGTTRSATGCVATAMAQVMYYHKWPTSATASIPGYTTGSYSLSVSSLSATTFSWSSMKDRYTNTERGPSATAVAKLMQYCGASVQMDYGPESGSYTYMVAMALKTYFDYNSTTQFVSRSYYTYAKWTDLIYHELAHARPVVYGGQSSGGGHEFVCDGYKYENDTDFFHINWGWGGKSNNYFVLSALDPDQQGIGGSSSTDGFHYGQNAVIGIQKSTQSGTIANISPNDVNLRMNSITLSNSTAPMGSIVNVTFNITNNSNDDYDGDIYLGTKKGNNYYLLNGNNCNIPAKQTRDYVVPFIPQWEGTYDLVLFVPGDDGYYYTNGEVGATLTVIEGATNKFVPIYGFYCDEYSRSQFIIPSANLQDMRNSYITGMTFFANETNVSWGSAEFDVYLSEVSGTTLSSLKNWNTLSKVYAGKLSISSSQMVITFDDAFMYNGGNLLVGINQTVTGSYVNCTWIGTTATGASLGGNNSSISQQDFLPTVTFDYTTSVTPYVETPTDVAVTPAPTSATVIWTGEGNSYNLKYGVHSAPSTYTCDFESVEAWSVDDFAPFTAYDGDGSSTYGVQNTAFTNQNYTGSVITMENGVVGTNWTAHAGNKFGCFMDCTTPPNNDFFITPEVTVTEGSTFSFWARSITDSYGLERMKVGVYSGNGTFSSYLAGSNTSYVQVPTSWTKYSYDLSAYAGQTIQLAINCVSDDAFALFIDDVVVYTPAPAVDEPITITGITTTSYLLKGLIPETPYDVQIQAINSEGSSDWTAPVTFTTQAPVEIELQDAGRNKSTIEAYNGVCANVTINGRTFRKDGSWQTICLPFDVDVEGSVLEGADVRALESVKERESVLLLNFPTSETKLQAGIPYIIKWDGGSDITNPVFENVTVSNVARTIVNLYEGNVMFGGSEYKLNTFDTSSGDSFIVDGSPILAPCKSGSVIKAFDAAFYVNKEIVSTLYGIALNTGNEDELIVGISPLLTSPEEEEQVYNLVGQRLSKKQKGVNIVGGKKLLVK